MADVEEKALIKKAQAKDLVVTSHRKGHHQTGASIEMRACSTSMMS